MTESPTIPEHLRQKHALMRSVSKGAQVSLAHTVEGYTAYGNCAKLIATACPTAPLEWLDGVQRVHIPYARMNDTLATLRRKHTVALLEVEPPTDTNRARFVALCVLERTGEPVTVADPEDLF